MSISARAANPLLEWMKSGDPDLVPVTMADAHATTASCFGVSACAEGQSASFN